MNAYFISDIHLQSVEERNGQTLLRFLTSLADEADAETWLFLLGDIFDLWVSDHAVFLRRFDPLLRQLEKFRERGGRIVYFEGNHGMHLEPYWKGALGAEVYAAPAYFELDGRTILCEHGDEINPEDVNYLRLRRFLRSAPLEFLAHRLPGGFWDWIGRKASDTSRQYSAADREKQEPVLRQQMRDHVPRVYARRPFDHFVSGHIHVFFDEKLRCGDREVRAINLGTWMDKPRILHWNRGEWSWIEPA